MTDNLNMEQPPIPESGHAEVGGASYVLSNWRVQSQEKLNESIQWDIFVTVTEGKIHLIPLPGALPTDVCICTIRSTTNPGIIIEQCQTLVDNIEVQMDNTHEIGLTINFVIFMSRDASVPT